LGLCLIQSFSVNAQHTWQKPIKRDAADVERIIGPSSISKPSRDLNIVWVWGVDKNHDRGAHEYGWVMDRFVNTLLPQVPRVTAERAMYFPTDEQWANADLIVFYLQSPKPWTKDHYAKMDAFQARGGGLIYLHLAILEGSGEELSKRIGLAYGTRDTGHGTTQWGPLPMPVSLTNAGSKSSIFEGFEKDFNLVDEHYWNLTGNPDEVEVLVTAPGGPTNGSTAPPKQEELDGKKWPIAWTKEAGNGKVFATVLGHNYFTFNDPYFRIILLRGMAWTMNESFEPFKHLVTRNLQR
jgi:type 1 glutamine amidotransferase